jgi:hypothetical protein
MDLGATPGKELTAIAESSNTDQRAYRRDQLRPRSTCTNRGPDELAVREAVTFTANQDCLCGPRS